MTYYSNNYNAYNECIILDEKSMCVSHFFKIKYICPEYDELIKTYKMQCRFVLSNYYKTDIFCFIRDMCFASIQY